MKKINFKLSALSFALLFFGGIGEGLYAKDVKGTVTDAATGKPMAGVNVEAYGNDKYAAMTDQDGKFIISNLPDYVASLFFRVEGMQSQQVAIGKNSDNITVKMFCDAFTSTYSRSTNAVKNTGAQSNSNNAELSIDPFIQQNLAADVRSIGRSGIDGDGTFMLINGINSLNANTQPLVVIDGIIMDMQYNREMLHDGYFNNILANINVNDIDKVEVMRNGTAIYGAKGANGVLFITTKRSRSMATKIDVTISGKFQLQPRTPEVMNATDYRTYATEMLSGIKTDVSSMKFLNTDPNYYYYNQYHNSTNWNNEVYRNGFTQNYGINVQGGDDVASYNLSVGYAKANATLKENNFSRFDMRLNTDIKIIKNLDVRFDASFSDVKRNLFDVGVSKDVESMTATAPNYLALIKSPFLSPYAIDINGLQSSFLAEADDYLEDCITTNDKSLANPSAILANGVGDNRNNFGNRLVMFTVAPKYLINKHLSIQEIFNFSLVNTNENYYLPISGVPTFRVPGISDRVYVNNVIESMTARQNSIQSDTRLAWFNRYNAHNISVYGGLRYTNSHYKLNTQRGYNPIGSGNDKTPNISTSLSYKSTDGADDKVTDITWYAVADYNFAEKYYLSGTLSAQSSSRFGKEADALKMFGVRWGIFPSLQGSWIMSNESWFPSNTINYLRLNLGYDMSGNDDIDYVASRTYFVAVNMLNNTIDGKVLGNVGNDKLKWETTRRLNAGLEANILNNRLSLGFSFFKSWTSDLLTCSQMSWTSGLSENWGNNGKLENIGYNFNISGKIINARDWHFEMGVSAGHYKNKLTALNNTDRLLTSAYGATIISQVGNPVGLFYGYKTEGVFATTEEAKASGLYYLDESNNRVDFQAGDVRFFDKDGNKEINDDDRVVIGDPNPDIYGAITARLNWKHFTLDANLTYSIGNDIYNYERSILESGKYFYNQSTAMINRWTTEGQQTSMPRISYQDPNGNSRFSDRWIEDGSYLRLSNITLSYRLPLNFSFLQGITVWGAVNNLFTLTKYLGSDPVSCTSSNVLYQGIDRGLLGLGRSFAMGIKINL